MTRIHEVFGGWRITLEPAVTNFRVSMIGTCLVNGLAPSEDLEQVTDGERLQSWFGKQWEGE